MTRKTDKLEHLRQYQRERRAAARAKGLCATCCARSVEPGRSYCGVCLARVDAARTPRATVRAVCLDCIAIGFHRAECSGRSPRRTSA